jgi:hypothetical protein
VLGEGFVLVTVFMLVMGVDACGVLWPGLCSAFKSDELLFSDG